ncbi:MAG: MarR family protein [Synergistetes bacterium ADurb.BinA166]|nr:MAG: MarR family protein [Synergistetes bacterium ADurb.BinA166]
MSTQESFMLLIAPDYFPMRLEMISFLASLSKRQAAVYSYLLVRAVRPSVHNPGNPNVGLVRHGGRPITQSRIAVELGMHGSHVSKTLGALERMGLISRQDGQIEVVEHLHLWRGTVVPEMRDGQVAMVTCWDMLNGEWKKFPPVDLEDSIIGKLRDVS